MATMSVSRADWTLHRKGHIDQQRHNEKIKEAIKQNLHEIVSREDIILSDGKTVVKVPIRSLEEYKFRFDPDKRDGVGQGQGGSKVGDTDGGRLVAFDMSQECLHERRQSERGAVHRRVVDTQAGAQPLEPKLGTDVVDARRIDLIRADHPAPQHARVDRHVPPVGPRDRERVLEGGDGCQPLAHL